MLTLKTFELPPQELYFREMNKFVIVTKHYFYFLERCTEFNFISLSVKNITGCIRNFDSPCVISYFTIQNPLLLRIKLVYYRGLR